MATKKTWTVNEQGRVGEYDATSAKYNTYCEAFIMTYPLHDGGTHSDWAKVIYKRKNEAIRKSIEIKEGILAEQRADVAKTVKEIKALKAELAGKKEMVTVA